MLGRKQYQDLDRESKIGDQVIHATFSGRPDSSSIPDLEVDLAEFKSRSGREKGWTELSVDERIEAAEQTLGGSILTRLHFARFMTY